MSVLINSPYQVRCRLAQHVSACVLCNLTSLGQPNSEMSVTTFSVSVSVRVKLLPVLIPALHCMNTPRPLSNRHLCRLSDLLTSPRKHPSTSTPSTPSTPSHHHKVAIFKWQIKVSCRHCIKSASYVMLVIYKHMLNTWEATRKLSLTLNTTDLLDVESMIVGVVVRDVYFVTELP